MTTMQRTNTQYTFVARTPAGGLSTSGPGGTQVRDDLGDVTLQDPTGAQISVSAQDFLTGWTIITP